MTESIKCIVFDWDGTLMDSESQIVHCLHMSIADLGLEPMPDDTVKNIIGLGLREAIDVLVPGRDEKFHRAFVDAYRKHWFAHDGSELFEGARMVLDRLKAHNILLGVATGKARKGLVRVLDETGLAGYFDATRCSDEAFSKPHPQMLQDVMAELSVSPVETVMVGDTTFDMEMAIEAGVGALGAAWGYHQPDDLLESGAQVIVETCSELRAEVEAFFAHKERVG